MLLVAVAAQAKEPVAIFHVGNSLTDQAYSVDRAFAQVVWDVVAEVTKAPPAK
jgi:hypothetical protein